MATAFGVFKNAEIIVNGVNLSDHVESVRLNVSQAALPNAAMGDESELIRPGLFNFNIEVTVFQDFQAGSIDATIYPLFSGRVQFPVTVKPVAGEAVGGTNPMFSGQFYVTQYNPIDGSHGDNLMTTIVFSPGEDMIRATS